MFFRGSRYQFVESNSIQAADGRVLVYKKTRFITPPAIVGAHAVTQADRLDLVAYRYLRDPLLFWRIADANLALWPPDLLATSGRRIGIPDPQG